MRVEPNFSETMAPNAPGIYICKIVGAELRYGKESGLPYLNWKLLTVRESRTVFYSTPLHGKGAGMFKHFVHSAGETSYESGPFDTETITGKVVSMKLAVDEKGYFAVKEVTAILPNTDEIPF